MLPRFIQKFARSRVGAGTSEYALLIGLIVLATIVALAALGGNVSDIFKTAENATTSPTARNNGPADATSCSLNVSINGSTTQMLLDSGNSCVVYAGAGGYQSNGQADPVPASSNCPIGEVGAVDLVRYQLQCMSGSLNTQTQTPAAACVPISSLTPCTETPN